MVGHRARMRCKKCTETLVGALGREARHLPSPSAEVKNGAAIHTFPHTSSWHGA
jgi:hypothetical protein